MSEAPVVLDEVIERARVTAFQWGIVLLCMLGTAVDGFDIQALAFAAPLIARAWTLQPNELGIVLTASVLGIVAGTILVGSRGDRIGRRPIVMASLACAALFTYAAGESTGTWSLGIVRFVAGIGLGGSIPNLIALALEHLPRRRRALGVVIIACGYPLGAAAGGAVAGHLSIASGWQSIFHFGGLITAAAVIACYFGLPESPAFAVARPTLRTRLVRTLQRIDPQLRIDAERLIIASEQRVAGSTFRSLFSAQRARTTVLLWIIFISNMAMMYFFINWLPTLFVHLGLDVPAAIRASAVFNAGGVVGGLGMAMLLRRFSSPAVLGWAYTLSAAAVGVLSGLDEAGALLLPTVFAAGVGIVGGQFILNAVAAQFYPSSMRATGLGAASGVGRVGAVLAPLVGGLLMTVSHDMQRIFLVAAVPAVIAGLASLSLWRHNAAASAKLT